MRPLSQLLTASRLKCLVSLSALICLLVALMGVPSAEASSVALDSLNRQSHLPGRLIDASVPNSWSGPLYAQNAESLISNMAKGTGQQTGRSTHFETLAYLYDADRFDERPESRSGTMPAGFEASASKNSQSRLAGQRQHNGRPRYDAPHLLRVSLDVVATKPGGALVEEGTYLVKTAQGEYVGQSGAISRRLQQHVASGKFTQAEVDAAERAMVTGGRLEREIAEQLLIDSKGGIDGLLNKVNPIGPKRVSVMPNQPYKR